MAVGTRIKNYLITHGISQSWLCERSRIPAARMSLILNEKRRMRTDDYERIVGALNVDGGLFIEPKKPEARSEH